MHTQTPDTQAGGCGGGGVGGGSGPDQRDTNDNGQQVAGEQRTGHGHSRGGPGGMKHDVIAMVGLPARGKTFISRSIVRYLNERGYECRVFNVGEYRRLSTDYTTHDFFASDNEYALQMRNKLAMDALEDLCSWLAKGDNRVAIYDATNSTLDRRAAIYDIVACKYHYSLLFIESICNKPNILEKNIKHKTQSPDYSRFDHDYAIKDFKQRIAHYEARYKPLGVFAEEEKYSFIQILNAGEDWHFHHCRSRVQLALLHFLVDLYTLTPITATNTTTTTNGTTTSSTTTTRHHYHHNNNNHHHHHRHHEHQHHNGYAIPGALETPAM